MGRKQAFALGQYLYGKNISILYTSDLPRAIRTAEIVGTVIRLRPTILGDLREVSTDVPKGWADSAEKLHRDFDYLLGGRESLRSLTSRAESVWRKIVSSSGGKDVAVVTHGIFTKALLYTFGYKNYLVKNKFIPHAAVTTIEYYKYQPKLTSFADFSHLRQISLWRRVGNLFSGKI
jgi:broad specificity phosphatase PhoE